MTHIDLGAKFPNLRPIRSAPFLFNICGFGFVMYGQRDLDEETGSFLQTHYLCVLFVPILALGAYRVVPTDQGWYILGREPISTPATLLNILTLLLAIGGGGYYGVTTYRKSPPYVARQKLAEADRLAEAGRVADAARLCAEVAVGPTEQAAAVAQRLAALMDRPAARQDPEALAAMFRSAVEVQKAGRWPEAPQVLYNRGMARVNDFAAPNPRGALAVLEAVAPLAPPGDDLNGLRRDLLEKIVAADPTNPEWASRLALIDEAQGQVERCRSLLEPLRDRLGLHEGARILGLLDARAGHIEPALKLLRPYTKAGLERLRRAEDRRNAAVEAAQKRVIERLKDRSAEDFDSDRYRRLDKSGREAMLVRYVEEKIKDDPEIARAQGALIGEAKVVPVALELGILLLQQAQSQADPQARKADLDEAEKTFLGINQLAGESLEYQLSLGQVYYWQGKHRQGRALFDQVLQSHHRDPVLLLQVADLLRDIGSDTEARALAEEAYNATSDADLKSRAALLRALLSMEIEDRILWLRRANSEDPEVKALLNSALAAQALERGDEAKAIDHLKQADSLYASMPESKATLNNRSLVLMQLASLTGDQDAYKRSAELIKKAAALPPVDSLTMSNAANSLLEASLRDIIGRSIDLNLLKHRAGVELIGFLFGDEAGYESVARRIRSHPGVTAALELMAKVTLLAPRNGAMYEPPFRVFAYLDDAEGLRKLWGRLEGVELDLGDDLKNAKENIAGHRDEEMRARAKVATDRAEAILREVRGKGRGPTFAAAARSVLQCKIFGASFGLDTDRDAAVALAEEACAAAPSLASRSALIDALLFRAQGRLARSDSEFAARAERVRRSSSPSELIAALLSADDRLRDVVLADADVDRAITLLRESCLALSHFSANGRTWALLHAKYPDEAAALAKVHLASESERLTLAISAKLSPFSTSTALHAYWRARMEGQGADALAVLKPYASEGVPLPIDIP